MRDSGGEAAECGHAFGGDDFPFEALEFGEVLEVVDEAHVLILRGAQRRNGKTEEAGGSFGSLVFDFLARGEGIALLVALDGPEAGENVGNFFAAMQTQAGTGNFRAGAIHHQDAAFHIGGEQAPAHGFNDVLIESLQIFKLFALGFEFDAFFAECLWREGCRGTQPRKMRRDCWPARNPGRAGWAWSCGARDDAVGDELQQRRPSSTKAKPATRKTPRRENRMLAIRMASR